MLMALQDGGHDVQRQFGHRIRVLRYNKLNLHCSVRLKLVGVNENRQAPKRDTTGSNRVLLRMMLHARGDVPLQLFPLVAVAVPKYGFIPTWQCIRSVFQVLNGERVGIEHPVHLQCLPDVVNGCRAVMPTTNRCVAIYLAQVGVQALCKRLCAVNVSRSSRVAVRGLLFVPLAKKPCLQGEAIGGSNTRNMRYKY